MTGNTSDIPNGFVAETNALRTLVFYSENYDTVVFRGLGAANNKPIILGSKPFKCRFCHAEPPEKTFKKRSHAVSELLGNKVLKTLYECDDCNARFGKFEDDLGKMTMPMRSIGGVIGKNGIPKLTPISGGTQRDAKVEIKGDSINFSRDAGDIKALVDDPVTKTLTLTFTRQRFRPLGAYKALCKSAFSLLEERDLPAFEELRQWLLEPDLATKRVYGAGGHFCCNTFVPAFQPFKQPIVCLLRRKAEIDAPFMSFFIATGNMSYQIFLPCPSMDQHLAGKTVTITTFPHFFQLQPWLAPGQTKAEQMDLNSPDLTSETTGTMAFCYEQKVRTA